MRLMLKFTIPVEKGNQAAQDGTLGVAIDKLIEQTQPEAAYFMVEQGKRAGMIFFELSDQAKLIIPVLNQDDLRKGLRNLAG